MKPKDKELTFTKPILLLVLQLIALFHIFHTLSSPEQFTENGTLALTFSLVFIMISSLITFKLLDRLREEEHHKERMPH